MKLATYELATLVGAIQRVGAVAAGGKIVDLRVACATRLARECDPANARQRAEWLIPLDMVSFLGRGDEARKAAAEALAFAESAKDRIGLDGLRMIFEVTEIRLASPLPRPTSIRDFSCIEEHYLAAIKRLGTGTVVPRSWYEWPPYYKGNPLTVIGPETDVIWPKYATEVDYELEVAMVIGKRGKDIPKERARAHTSPASPSSTTFPFETSSRANRVRGSVCRSRRISTPGTSRGRGS